MKSFQVLVVDDETNQREVLSQILAENGYHVLQAEDFKSAEKTILSQPIDLVISDFKMPGGTGLDVAKLAIDFNPSCGTIIITAYADIQSVIEALRMGVSDYMLKPLNVDALLSKVEMLEHRKALISEVALLRREINRTHREPGDFIGKSKAISEIRDLISSVAETNGTVLISGESGTGKEIVARQIHKLSKKPHSPFIALNCGAIPENLLESELFGHKKGSFTGATSDSEGLILAARGGTLFLDEIGEMPKNLQVKLLRVLQDKCVTPIGSSTPLKVETRIIAATNRNLNEMVAQDLFRKDLYYRLNVIEIKLPPLRERMEDLPEMVDFLMSKICKELAKPELKIGTSAMRRLMSYSWPGNIRELENVLERAAILCKDPQKLDSYITLPGVFSDATDKNEDWDLEKATNSFIRKHILEVLDATDGDKKEAAKKLGLGLSSLYRKLEELEIPSKNNEK